MVLCFHAANIEEVTKSCSTSLDNCFPFLGVTRKDWCDQSKTFNRHEHARAASLRRAGFGNACVCAFISVVIERLRRIPEIAHLITASPDSALSLLCQRLTNSWRVVSVRGVISKSVISIQYSVFSRRGNRAVRLLSPKGGLNEEPEIYSASQAGPL